MSAWTRALLSALVLASCVDFDQALETCARPGGRCLVDAGLDAGLEGVDAGSKDADLDAGVDLDAGASDAGATDAGTTDAGTTDAGTTDAGATDAGATDAGATDAGATDAGTPDAGASDAGGTDAGASDAGPPPTWSYFAQDHQQKGIRSTYATAPGDLWFAGETTGFSHLFDGGFFNTYLGAIDSYSVVTTGPTGHAMVYVGGEELSHAVLYKFAEPYDGVSDSPGQRRQFDTLGAVTSVFTAGADVYAATFDLATYQLVLLVEDAGAWSQVSMTPDASIPTRGWGAGHDDFYVLVDEQSLLHFDHGTLRTMALSHAVRGLWGLGNAVWVAGNDYVGVVEDGGERAVATQVDGGNWNTLWVADDGTVFVGGYDHGCQGSVLRISQGVTQRTCLTNTAQVWSMHGSSSSDVWAGDSSGTIWHFSP